MKRSDNSATSTHGDSGGPVYRVRADGSAGVRGIISAGIYDVAADKVSCPSTAFSPGGNCWRRTFFIPIQNITDYWTDLEVELH
ncbi:MULTISPECIES: hypothetical protein [Aeromicrobium]|uniref:hypothetical protein n=1 Tax=Aeromicrobium TaxID=2040 RepID=UPI002579DE97|nr:MULTISPECIES: hypothetical protein [Aeromicrobium]